MSSQAVNFGGQSYQFPADAKDDEILSFLNDAHRSAASPIPPPKSPIPGSPSTQPMEYTHDFTGSAEDRPPSVAPALQKLGKNVATGIANTVGTTPIVAHRLLQKNGVVGPGSRMFPGEANMGDYIPSKTGGPGIAALTMAGGIEGGGVESVPEEGSIGPGRVAAPPNTDVAAASGTESATAATKLLQKVPGTRSNIRDAVGIIHGLHNPTSPWGVMDAVTSVNSWLAKHNAGADGVVEAEAETNTTPLSQGFTTTSVRPQVTPSTIGNTDWGAKSTRDFQLPTSPAPPVPGPARPAPSWQTSDTDTAGTPVEPVAPHTQGKLTADDISTMLEKTGPVKGGKGQVGRAILRKNVKSIQSDIQPEGPAKLGTGPGAMLRKGAEIGPEIRPGPSTGPGITLHHGTQESNVQSILKHGLDNTGGTGQDGDAAYDGYRAYVSKAPETANWWSKAPYGGSGTGDGVRVEVEVPKSAIRPARVSEPVAEETAPGSGLVSHKGEFEGVTSGKPVPPQLIKRIVRVKDESPIYERAKKEK